MRRSIALSLLLTACTGNLGPRGIPVSFQARGVVVVPASLHVRIDARVHVEPPPPPPPPAPAVALQGAPVVEFFGIPLEGANDVVFVLDVSGSMDDPARGQIAQISAPPAPDPNTLPQADPNTPPPPPPDPNAPPPPPAPPAPPPPRGPRKIEVAQAELVEALQKLPAGTRMNVVFFNNYVDGIAPGIVPLDETNRSPIIDTVRGTDASGRTALAPAMRLAFMFNARRVVLLSDGLGNVGGDSDDVMRDAREAIRGGVRIDTIGIGVDQDRRLLATLANESGGLYQGF